MKAGVTHTRSFAREPAKLSPPDRNERRPIASIDGAVCRIGTVLIKNDHVLPCWRGKPPNPWAPT
jgi:hypothetical protein